MLVYAFPRVAQQCTSFWDDHLDNYLNRGPPPNCGWLQCPNAADLPAGNYYPPLATITPNVPSMQLDPDVDSYTFRLTPREPILIRIELQIIHGFYTEEITRFAGSASFEYLQRSNGEWNHRSPSFWSEGNRPEDVTPSDLVEKMFIAAVPADSPAELPCNLPHVLMSRSRRPVLSAELVSPHLPHFASCATRTQELLAADKDLQVRGAPGLRGTADDPAEPR